MDLLYWVKPLNGGSDITSYKIYVYSRVGASYNWQIYQEVSVPASDTYKSITGTNNYWHYMIKVSAINIIGESVASSIITETVNSDIQILVLPNDSSSVYVSWPRTIDGGSIISYYSISYYSFNSNNIKDIDNTISNISSSLRKYKVEGLLPGRNYIFFGTILSS